MTFFSSQKKTQEYVGNSWVFDFLKRKSNLDAISVMLYELNTVTIKTVTASGIFSPPFNLLCLMKTKKVQHIWLRQSRHDKL